MEVLDVNGNPLESYDPQTGRIVAGSKTIHHVAVKGVEEQGHYETIREYPNGGKDVEWITDVPGIPTCEAWDEETPTYTYIPYTPSELQAASMPAAPTEPTLAERNRADIDFLAMMGGVDL